MKTISIGDRYGRLTVETEVQQRGHGKNYIGCVCTCGTKRYVALADLLEGRQKSCGCLGKEVSLLLKQVDESGNLKYGALTEYRAWSNAHQKCDNPRSASFTRNGGRGIKVCAEWAGDFPAFFRSMGRCPVGHSLIRLEPDADFSPDNCRWSQSKRGQVFEYRGEHRTASGWATTLAIPIGFVLDALEDDCTIAEIQNNYLTQKLDGSKAAQTLPLSL